MTYMRKIAFILSGMGMASLMIACQGTQKNTQEVLFCPEGFVETTNLGIGEPTICCPYGTTGQDGFCVDTPADFEQNPTIQSVEPTTIVTEGIKPEKIEAEPAQSEENQELDAGDFVYLTAPNGKGSAYCPKRASSLAWNGTQYKCCGYGMQAVAVPSREDSICCHTGTLEARWIGKEGFDYECCPKGLVEVQNEGTGDKYICCQKGQIAKDGVCMTTAELKKQGKVLMTALGNGEKAYCPENANSLAWNATDFQCCGTGMKATLVPSRKNSICCPDDVTDARWVGKKWNDFECCPEGTVETKNIGDGDKYVCCPQGNKAINGECLSVK